MDFQNSVIFAAALIVIAGAGILLGMAIRGRNNQSIESIEGRKAILYSEIVMSMDNLATASSEYKQYFIQRYYQALVYAPDTVVKALNNYLASVAGGADTEKLLADRDAAVLAMRRDVLGNLNDKTSLNPTDLQTIAVEEGGRKGGKNPLAAAK